MRTRDASRIITELLKEQIPYLLVGAPGIGKTDINEQARQELGLSMVVSHLVTADPTDTKGIPWPDAVSKRANFLPIGEVADVLEATEPTLWFWDDFGQAVPSVQAACMQWLLARRSGGHILPDCVTIGLATNRRQDRAGVSGILEPVKSRLVILPVEAHIDDFSSWALSNDVDTRIIAFLRNCNQVPGKDSQGNNIEMLSPETTSTSIENSPSPRTWKRASDILKIGFPKDLQMQALKGCIGESAAVTLSAWIEVLSSMVNLDSILIDPAGSPLPKTLGEKFAISTGLAGKCTVSSFASIAQYATRMLDAGMGEFSMLCIKDCQHRVPAIKSTNAYLKLTVSKMWDLVMGTTGSTD